MNLRILVSVLVFLIGEALLVKWFLYFGTTLETEILFLNITVSTVVYGVVAMNLGLLPWIDVRDETQKDVGSIGIRWIVNIIYIVLSVSVLCLFGILNSISFTTQLLIHLSLFFFLLVGWLISFSSSTKTSAIYVNEKYSRMKINEMRKALAELKFKLEKNGDIPLGIINRIEKMHDDLRFLSPSNNNTAMVLEDKFIQEVKMVTKNFSDNPSNIQIIASNLIDFERIYEERKQIILN